MRGVRSFSVTPNLNEGTVMKSTVYRGFAALLVAVLAASCSTTREADRSTEYVTRSDLAEVYRNVSEQVLLESVKRTAAEVPEVVSKVPDRPGAAAVISFERAQVHDGKLITGPDGQPIMERGYTVVKSSTFATISGANKATAGLLTAATDDQGRALYGPNGYPIMNVLSGYGSASGDTVQFGRSDELLDAQAHLESGRIEAAAAYLREYYDGKVKLRKADGEVLVSVIKEGRETALGVLERVTPVGAAVLGAEQAVKIYTKDDAGDRVVEVEKPAGGG